jgi:pimeloyl-ACP methyl ester carboxylesterase
LAIALGGKLKTKPPAMIKSRTIVFITGAFVSHACWDNWKSFFESKGYHVIAPPWPAKEGSAVTLRNRHPDPALAAVTLPAILNDLIRLINSLPEKPILIGHSFGGLMAQVLMNKGLADAVVAIHAAPPKSVIPYEFAFLKSNARALGYFTPVNKTYMRSFKSWQYAFTNGMSMERQKDTYYHLAIPESKRAVRGGLTSAARIDFQKEHVPLLLIAGSKDNCIPAHLCKRVFESYKHNGSVTEFVLKDRNHFVLGLPTWQEDATGILNWLRTH